MPALEEILQLPSGASWCKADLHVHTPASKDFYEDITPNDIVQTALSKGLDVMAVTDHNSAAWCDSVVNSAKGTPLTVFPGIEISTPQGHLIAIFDVDVPASDIEDMLALLIPRDQFASLETSSTQGIREVSSIIEAAGGIAIAAHIDGKKGFWNTVTVANERKKVYSSPDLRCLEIVDESLRDTYQNGLKTEYTRRIACIQSSDSMSPGSDQHELKSIGSRYSYIKMGERNLSGLKLAFIDPEMRISLSCDARQNPTNTIISLRVTGGFLNDQVFRFNENVNCLIGDTGAGKSVALELLRFCFDQPPVVPKIRAEVARLIDQQLGNLSIVHTIIKKDDTYYLVERTYGSPPTAPSISRFTAVGSEAVEGAIDMQRFFPIKAFSQSEIIEYAREPEVRLSLTDDLIDCTGENSRIAELKAQLGENAAAYNAEKSKESNILAQLEALPTLQESLTQLDKLLNDPRIKQHQSWYKEKNILDQAAQQLATMETAAESAYSPLQIETPTTASDVESYPNSDLMNNLITVYGRWQQVVDTSRKSTIAEIKKFSDNIGSITAIWNTRFEKAEAEYVQLLSEIDTDGKGLRALSQRRQEIDSQISALNSLKSQLESEIIPRVQSLFAVREDRLNKLQTERMSITSKREAKANELSAKLRQTIVLRVHPRSSKTLFRRDLYQLGEGSGLRTTDYDSIAEKHHPIPFVKELISRDYAALTTRTGIDASRFEKLREFIVERNLADKLYKLQLTDVDDEIEVSLKVEPDTDTYKPIEELAHGQKCMVILMIALAEGDFPLIVDQPEDALHAPGIETGIVSTLRDRRGMRQCIFATRSANIIVSADAEQILPLKADAIHGELVGCGCLDSYSQKELVLYHVEGGEEAFQRRLTMYYLRPTP